MLAFGIGNILRPLPNDNPTKLETDNERLLMLSWLVLEDSVLIGGGACVSQNTKPRPRPRPVKKFISSQILSKN
jgi:hypothetical protein